MANLSTHLNERNPTDLLSASIQTHTRGWCRGWLHGWRNTVFPTHFTHGSLLLQGYINSKICWAQDRVLLPGMCILCTFIHTHLCKELLLPPLLFLAQLHGLTTSFQVILVSLFFLTPSITVAQPTVNTTYHASVSGDIREAPYLISIRRCISLWCCSSSMRNSSWRRIKSIKI